MEQIFEQLKSEIQDTVKDGELFDCFFADDIFDIINDGSYFEQAYNLWDIYSDIMPKDKTLTLDKAKKQFLKLGEVYTEAEKDYEDGETYYIDGTLMPEPTKYNKEIVNAFFEELQEQGIKKINF